MRKQVVVSGMVGNKTLLYVLGRSLGGIGMVVVRQNGSVTSPIPIQCTLVDMEKWGVIEAWASFSLPSAESVKWSFVLNDVVAISSPYAQFCSIAKLGVLSVRHELRVHMRSSSRSFFPGYHNEVIAVKPINVMNFTFVAQHGGVNTSAVGRYPFYH